MPSWWTMVWFMVNRLVNYPLEEYYNRKKNYHITSVAFVFSKANYSHRHYVNQDVTNLKLYQFVVIINR